MPKDLLTQTEENEMQTTKKKAKRRSPEFVKTRPVALQKLVDRIGIPRAAEMLGLSDPPIRDALRDGEWRLAFERAAADALRQITPEQEPETEDAKHLVIGKVPASEVERVVNGAAFLGVELMDLGEL